MKDKGAGHIRYIKLNVKTAIPPLNVSSGMYEKYYNNFDMSTVHIKYDRNFFNSLMRNSTKYISILRDPVTQFESAFTFFGYAKDKKLSVAAQIEKWLQNPKKIRFLNNNQIFDLGLTEKWMRNKTTVTKHIAKLSNEFDLMLIAEYFDESLLLLRKLMCWNFTDILYIKQNARSARSSHSHELTETLMNKIRQWNSADFALYQHFNKTFWEKVENYGPDFSRDLRYFRDIQSVVYKACVEKSVLQKKGRIIYRQKYDVGINATEYCIYMANRQRDVFHKIWARQKIN